MWACGRQTMHAFLPFLIKCFFRVGIKRRTGIRKGNTEAEYGTGIWNQNAEPELGIKHGIGDKTRNNNNK